MRLERLRDLAAGTLFFIFSTFLLLRSKSNFSGEDFIKLPLNSTALGEKNSALRYDPPPSQPWSHRVYAHGLESSKNASRQSTVAIVSSCLASSKYSAGLSHHSFLNKQKYCDKHEHVRCYLHNVSLDDRFSAHWNKFPLLAKSLEMNDFAVWMDCDAVFLNMDATFAETGLFSSAKDLILTSDHNGINTGVFAVRNSAWSLKFLSLLYAQRGSVDYFNSLGKGSGFVDQQGLKILREKYYTKSLFSSHVDFDPKFTESLNSYCMPSSFIHHRVNCNSVECDNYLVCLVEQVRNNLNPGTCPPPAHLKNLCKKQKECCSDKTGQSTFERADA